MLTTKNVAMVNGTVRRRLEGNPPKVVANRYPGACFVCGQFVPARAGLAIRIGNGPWTVRHSKPDWDKVDERWVGGCSSGENYEDEIRKDRPRPLIPADVTVHADTLGRDVITIPDDLARRLRCEVKYGWTEVPKVQDGYSRTFEPGSWVADTVETILAAYADSPIPDGADTDDRRRYAEGYRFAARTRRVMQAWIVGRSGFDGGTREWAPVATRRPVWTESFAHPADDGDVPGYQFWG